MHMNGSAVEQHLCTLTGRIHLYYWIRVKRLDCKLLHNCGKKNCKGILASLCWKLVYDFLFDKLSIEIDWSHIQKVHINFLTIGFFDAYITQKFRLWNFFNSADVCDGVSSVNQNACAE